MTGLRGLGFYLALSILWVGAYLGLAASGGESGFPLDDAWIHQTYARNLATNGRWEFAPGVSSAGSTSPLWTLMLAAGYLVRAPFLWWTWGLGAVLLGLLGWLASRLAVRVAPESGWLGLAAGVLCVSEWHLVWAAVSGMETILFAVLAVALVDRYDTARQRPEGGRLTGWGWMGVLAGLLVLTRPEGVILAALAAIGLLYGVWCVRSSPGDLVRSAALAVVSFSLLVGPYLLYNLDVSGRLWPNTLYAKQAEYAAEMAVPLVTRLGRVTLPVVTGFQALLLPGWIALGWRGWERLRVWRSARCTRAPGAYSVLAGYVVAHLLIYSMRLPVTYQHGRYVIPVIPYGNPAGGAGYDELAASPPSPAVAQGHQSELGSGHCRAAGGIPGRGASAFAKDVRIIQSEMVAVARWIADNTGPHDLVAAHDIGAIGYFAGRSILDLAGLVSPDVVPFMSDEGALARYVLESDAGYLVTAPGWPYDGLTRRAGVEMLYSADSVWTAAEGMNSSKVYRLSADQ